VPFAVHDTELIIKVLTEINLAELS